MFSLYIDTHNAQIVLGLFQDDELISKKIKISTKNHSDYTMPLIRELLEENSLTAKDLKEILVINGPGSFTGVRIGVTIAKTLAFTLDIPIKSMTSLEMMALSSQLKDNKISVIPDVKGVFLGSFDKENNLIGQMEYLSNKEYEKFKEGNTIPIVEQIEVDLKAIYNGFKRKKTIIAHKANPVYIKVIEALKHD